MKLPALAILVLAAGALIAAGCGDSSADTSGSNGDGAPDGRRFELAPIDEIELIVRESFPPQYAVRIVSGLPNGCAEFYDASVVGRTGSLFEVRVRNTMPADPDVVCTAIYGMHEETVELGADLTSGTEYTVKVNDKELKFTAQ